MRFKLYSSKEFAVLGVKTMIWRLFRALEKIYINPNLSLFSLNSFRKEKNQVKRPLSSLWPKCQEIKVFVVGAARKDWNMKGEKAPFENRNSGQARGQMNV